jgi:transposase-like protein
MTRHARFDDPENTRRYTDVYYEGLMGMWRDQYEESLRTGTPAPNLPREVVAATIQSARRQRSDFIADVLSRCLRQLARLLRIAMRPGK